MFFWNFLACFDDSTDVGNLISGSFAFSKSSLNTWKFTVHTLLKPGLENFEHYFASVWEECNCVVVWAFFGIALLWDWNENWPFPVLWPLLSFPNLLAYWVQHFHSIIFQDLKCYLFANTRQFTLKGMNRDRQWEMVRGRAKFQSQITLCKVVVFYLLTVFSTPQFPHLRKGHDDRLCIFKEVNISWVSKGA